MKQVKSPSGKENGFFVYDSRLAVVGAADFFVTAHAIQKRSDLHVAAEFKRASGGLRRRDQFERFRQPIEMFLEIGPREFRQRQCAQRFFELIHRLQFGKLKIDHNAAGAGD